MWHNDNLHRKQREGLQPDEESVVVYGTTWCGMTQLVRRYLERMEIPYTYFDIEDDKAALNQLRWLTGGYSNHPTVVIEGEALIEPDIDELGSALRVKGYL